MYIDKSLLDITTIDNPVDHLYKILNSIFYTEKGSKRDFEMLALLQSISVMNVFCQKYNLSQLKLTQSNTDTTSTLTHTLTGYYRDFLVNNPRVYEHYFDVSVYSLDDDEFQTIQNNINFLRDAISKSKVFSEEHKARLLAKLEKLQAEFHQKMATLDKALGTLLSIGRTLRRFGEEVSPIVDKVNETLRIVFRVEDKGNNLPTIENQISYDEPLSVEMVEEA